jgi:GntR family transcriptional regulator, transcriptional repressor for pyruvate dehydrogenase complex
MEASEAMGEKTKIEKFKVPIVRQSVSDQVAERILELVRNRTLRAGDQLPTERDLAASLHVSRPSVREAIRGLTLMGIVRSVQGGGAYIGDLDAQSLLEPLQFFISLENVNIQELYDARTVIESNVARRAAQFMTEEGIGALENIYKLQKATLDDPVRFRISDGLFHELIWEGCRNAFLSRIGKSLHVIGQEFRQRASETPGVLGQSYSDHRLLLKAIKARKPDAAAQAAAKHMQNVLQSTLAKSNWAA